MKTVKYLSALLLLNIITFSAFSQDAIIIADGNFVRGTIQGTDFQQVGLKKENGEIEQYNAKDIKEFLWNGETYVSKPFLNRGKSESRFFKRIETGAINLYTMGGRSGTEKRRRSFSIVPSIGVGIGMGGFRGFGLGGGVSFGGGRNPDQNNQQASRPGLIYIEKPGTGDMLEITPDLNNPDANLVYIKNTLMDKFSDDQELSESVKNMRSIDVKTIQKLVKSYNSVHQVKN